MKRKWSTFLLWGAVALVVGHLTLIADSSVKSTLEEVVNRGTAALFTGQQSPRMPLPEGPKVDADETASIAGEEAENLAEELKVEEQIPKTDEHAIERAAEEVRERALEAIARDRAGLPMTAADKAAVQAYEDQEAFGTPWPRSNNPLDDNGGTTFTWNGDLRIPPTGTGGTDSMLYSFSSALNVSGLNGIILDVEVEIDSLTHTFDGDLNIYLVSPIGTMITLSSDNGGAAENMFHTRFDDDAANSIVGATAPMTGDFRPEQPLSTFDTEAPNGDWLLIIYDDAGGDTGHIYQWELQILIADLTHQHDFYTASVLSPTPGGQTPGGTAAVTARFVNLGLTTEASPVSYQFNGGAVVTETTVPLAQLGSAIHTFVTLISLPAEDGWYPLTVWTALPGDEDQSNDTLEMQVYVRGGASCASAVLLTGTRDSLFANNCGAGDDDPGQSCGASGQDMVFGLDVPPGLAGSIWQSFNTLDSRHTLRWGGLCPGDSLVACVSTPDDQRPVWLNTTGATQRIYYTVGGYSLTTPCGDFTLQWEIAPPPPGDNCDDVWVLAGTRDSLTTNNCTMTDNTPGQSCGASSKDMVFSLAVPPGMMGSIWQSFNNIDSRHSLRWGGACPGDSLVGCVDDPDYTQYAWLNNTGAPQTLYYVVGGYTLTTACGDFTLQWEIMPPPPGDDCGDVIVLTGARDSTAFNNCAMTSNTPGQPCGASGKDMVFSLQVPNGFQGSIWQSSNTFDSRHTLAWGGACPGVMVVGCFDSPDDRKLSFTNTTGATQSLYYTVGGYSLSTACGSGVLQWELTPCTSVGVPFSENFDGVSTPVLPECWTSENLNGDVQTWGTYSTNPHSTPNSVSLIGTSVGNNDWLFTKGIQLTGGEQYTLDFWRRGGSNTVPESLAVSYGPASNSGSMFYTLMPMDTFMSTLWTQEAVSFFPPTDGIYYIGFLNMTHRSSGRMYIDDLQVYPQGCSAPTVTVNDTSAVGQVTLRATAEGGFGGPVVWQWYTGTLCTPANAIPGANSATFVTTVSGDFAVRGYKGDSVNCAGCDWATATVLPPPPGDNCTDPLPLTMPDPNGMVQIWGNTSGWVANCPDTCDYRSYGPDIFYTFTLTDCRRITMALSDSSGSAGDMHLALYDGAEDCCNFAFLCNDDRNHFDTLEWEQPGQRPTGSLSSFLGGEIPAGTYIVRVGKYGSGSGSFRLTVYDNGPCACSVTCQPNDIAEVAEDYRDHAFSTADPDGGCNNTVPAFGTVECSQTICGVGFTYQPHVLNNSFRDTDWYNFTVNGSVPVTVTVRSGFTANVFVMNTADCANQITFLQGTSPACSTTVLTGELAAGNYTLVVTPAYFTGHPFPTPYRANVVCGTPCTPDTVTDVRGIVVNSDGDPLANDILIRWTGDMAFPGTYSVYTNTIPEAYPGTWQEIASGITPVPGVAQQTFLHEDAATATSRRFYLVIGVCP